MEAHVARHSFELRVATPCGEALGVGENFGDEAHAVLWLRLLQSLEVQSRVGVGNHCLFSPVPQGMLDCHQLVCRDKQWLDVLQSSTSPCHSCHSCVFLGRVDRSICEVQ